MSDIAGRLGQWAAQLSLPAIPAAARRAALRSIVDVVGVALAGSKTGLAARVRDHVSRAHAARALKLDAQATAHAIRIAACQASGLRIVFGTPSKPYLCGRAALTGVDAALSARAGIAGPGDVFEAPDGFFALLGDVRLEGDEFAMLGRRFALIDPGIAFKLFPMC